MLKKYQQPDHKKASIQLLNSFLPFLGLLVLMYFSLDWSYLFTLALASVAAFFLVRIFIIQHDCGHQSFLKSRKLNNVIGFMSSFFSTIPFKYWSRTHNSHHATNGQLEHRGLGDIHFLTIEEYRSRSAWGKFSYRMIRMPIVQFFIIPVFYLLLNQRNPYIQSKGKKKIDWSHVGSNLALLAVYGLLAILLGWQKVLLIYVPIVLIFIVIAFWFFYVQHQQTDNYKEWKADWNHLLASIRGSTYYKLPRLFQWLSGNIGFHHIHHLNSRIPNYNLAACSRENPLLNQFVPILTFWKSLSCFRNKLWNAQTQQMISFKEYGMLQAQKVNN